MRSGIIVAALCLLVACSGETGPQGEPGERGPAGERGEKGDPGDEGVDGTDGVDGAPGADGADGLGLVWRDATHTPIPILGIDEVAGVVVWRDANATLWRVSATTGFVVEREVPRGFYTGQDCSGTEYVELLPWMLAGEAFEFPLGQWKTINPGAAPPGGTIQTMSRRAATGECQSPSQIEIDGATIINVANTDALALPDEPVFEPLLYRTQQP